MAISCIYKFDSAHECEDQPGVKFATVMLKPNTQ